MSDLRIHRDPKQQAFTRNIELVLVDSNCIRYHGASGLMCRSVIPSVHKVVAPCDQKFIIKISMPLHQIPKIDDFIEPFDSFWDLVRPSIFILGGHSDRHGHWTRHACSVRIELLADLLCQEYKIGTIGVIAGTSRQGELIFVLFIILSSPNRISEINLRLMATQLPVQIDSVKVVLLHETH